MSINNGDFDPNDPNCATPAVDACEDPTPPPGDGGPSEEGGEQPHNERTPSTPRSRFLGTRSGPRNTLANKVIGTAFRSGFREITLVPPIFYSKLNGASRSAVIFDFDSYQWNLHKVLSGTDLVRDDLDNLRIFLRKVWIRDSFHGDEDRANQKEYFLSNFAELSNISTDSYTPGPGYLRSMIYTITGWPGGNNPEGNVYPGPETFHSRNNRWQAQVNLAFPAGQPDTESYLTSTDENQGSPLPATGDWAYNKYFIDDVFQSPLPFSKREMDWIVNPQFSLVTINPVVNYFDETKTDKTVMHMKSIYRAHFGALNELPPECLENDKIQKFSSDSIQEMKRANETLKNNYDQYVEISINTSQGSPITTLMDEYQMDKYFLDMASEPQSSVERVLIKDQTMFGNFMADAQGQSTSAAGLADELSYQQVNVYPRPLDNDDYLSISSIKSRPLEFFRGLQHELYPLKYLLDYRHQSKNIIFLILNIYFYKICIY